MLRKKLESSINHRLSKCDTSTLLAVYRALGKLERRPQRDVKVHIVELLEDVDDERILNVIKWILLKN